MNPMVKILMDRLLRDTDRMFEDTQLLAETLGNDLERAAAVGEFGEAVMAATKILSTKLRGK